MKNAPHSSASAHQRRGSRTADATRPADADDSIVNLQGRSQLPRHDPARGSSGRSVMHTPRRRETGRPRAAQFGSRAVYIPGGSATWCGKEGAQDGQPDLLSRARAGDGEAFRAADRAAPAGAAGALLRMLGSFADAENAVQETMLAAWQGIGGFTEERASLRTWLYKIATSRCLNARRAASRRPAREWDVSRFAPLVPTRATRPSGCSRFLTPSSRVPPACRPGRRPATSRPRPSRWPS